MPENEKRDMQAQGEETTLPAETKMQKFDREQLSRRAALKKMGLTTGMALFAMFSVDDLAHMVGRAMEQRKGDSRVADQIAREFQSVGIALANSLSQQLPNCDPNGAGTSVAGYCLGEHPNPSSATCSECCGGVFRNYCQSSGVTWPPGATVPSYLDDNTYDDGHVCYDKCTGIA